MLWICNLFVRLVNWVAPLWGQRRVANIDTDEVLQLLEQGPDTVILVDVRSEQEIAVSMIPGAITKANFEARREQLRTRTIVTYCTVGGRSLGYAARLSQEGFSVHNYQGSILAWCAKGRSLVTPDGVPTRRVHTYSRMLFKVPEGYQQH